MIIDAPNLATAASMAKAPAPAQTPPSALAPAMVTAPATTASMVTATAMAAAAHPPNRPVTLSSVHVALSTLVAGWLLSLCQHLAVCLWLTSNQFIHR